MCFHMNLDGLVSILHNNIIIMLTQLCLKMLGLYLYNLIISHKSCKMLSILNKLILPKDLQNIVTNSVFKDKILKHKNNKTKNQT